MHDTDKLIYKFLHAIELSDQNPYIEKHEVQEHTYIVHSCSRSEYQRAGSGVVFSSVYKGAHGVQVTFRVLRPTKFETLWYRMNASQGPSTARIATVINILGRLLNA